MVEENAPTRAIIPNGPAHDFLRNDHRNRNRFVFWTRRLDEQPLGRREPLTWADDAIQINFEFGAVDLTLGVLLKADGKASQRFFDLLQYAPVDMVSLDRLMEVNFVKQIRMK